MSAAYVACGFNAANFMEKAYNIVPDEWQEKLLRKYPQKTALLCSRQAGKSTVCAVMALHEAVFKDGALVLIISNAFRQAEETFRKVKAGLAFVSKIRNLVYETQTMLELSNGSRVVSLPGKQETIRSFSSVSLMIIDEASQVSDDLYRSVRPMLAVSKGRLVALTTPFGKRGWFYNSWTNGTGWYKVKVTADNCPRITEDFLKEELTEIGRWWVNQEYYCEFVDSEDQLFGHDLLMSSITTDVVPLKFG